jgi:anthranilate synthase component 1
MSATPELALFARLAQRYQVVPVWRDLLADTETPVGVFRRVGTEVGSVLLESVETGDRWGRFSFIGLDPFTTLLVRGGAVSWTDGPICPVPGGASLVETLRAVTRTLRAPEPGELPDPPPLSAGAICALGGDALHPATGSAAGSAADPAGPPESAVVFPSVMIVFDHFRQRLRLVANVLIEPGRAAEAQYADALSRLDGLAARLAATEDVTAVPLPVATPTASFDSEIPDDAYRRMVEAAHRRVIAGDLRQVTVSRRFGVPAAADPFAVYRVLRITNPSPYLYFLRLPGVTLAGSSPQGLVGVRDGTITTHVIAGTRPRGEDDDADRKLAAELLGDAKERDEHAMLVDLALADLAPIAHPGTVRVPHPARVVRYSRVMHLVTDVTAVLADGRTALDAWRAVFPPGTVTGTPREVAVRLIHELEPRPRGLYGGAVGHLDFAGNLDLCLAVRTLQFHGGMAYCQAGAGVVAGSVAEREVQESRAKASALFAALQTAATSGLR